jgi:hypothetical protein
MKTATRFGQDIATTLVESVEYITSIHMTSNLFKYIHRNPIYSPSLSVTYMGIKESIEAGCLRIGEVAVRVFCIQLCSTKVTEVLLAFNTCHLIERSIFNTYIYPMKAHVIASKGFFDLYGTSGARGCALFQPAVV